MTVASPDRGGVPVTTVNYSLKDPTEVLDADMTPADIGLDRPVRDYLVAMLTDHRRFFVTLRA